jgi:hypothetical protein
MKYGEAESVIYSKEGTPILLFGKMFKVSKFLD